MFSHLALYYLNQMGITPWVTKERVSHLSIQSNEKNNYRLIVLSSVVFNDKMHSLFDQMMRYLDLQHDDVLVLNANGHELDNSVAQWTEPLSIKKTQAVLSLGPNINNLNLPYPKFQSTSLEYLLNNSSSKKDAFQVLTHLKICLQR